MSGKAYFHDHRCIVAVEARLLCCNGCPWAAGSSGGTRALHTARLTVSKRGGPLGGREQWWDQGFADGIHFTADPVVARPDVIESGVNEDDEFVILATDGLWCALVSVAAWIGLNNFMFQA